MIEFVCALVSEGAGQPVRQNIQELPVVDERVQARAIIGGAE